MQLIDIPILITGAGPTGLTLANLLAKMNIPFMLVEKNSQPSLDSKAFGIHARSLEIFDQIGIADRAVAEGKVDNKVHLVIKDKVTWKADISNYIEGKSNYPHFLILPQQKTEQLLIDALEKQGVWYIGNHKRCFRKGNKSTHTISVGL
jgi:2-polyprenyl-6-methoxyphenol hydroxylase-like FAD-dependent oxidoreductase